MNLLTDYWPFWLAGAAMTVVPLCYGARNFGLSGVWERVLYCTENIDVAENDAFAKNEALMQDAREGREINKDKLKNVGVYARKFWLAQVMLLVGIAVGGLIDAVMRGDFALRTDLGSVHAELFGTGPAAWLILFAGGLMVGWGTRFAGGCTSGHGLTGCGGLQVNSLIATAVFFGTGITVSIALHFFLIGGLPW